MTPESVARLDRRGRRAEWLFVLLMGVLFTYALLALLGIAGASAPFQPRRFAVLTGAMLLQPVAALLMRRSRATGLALLGLSLVALVAASMMAS